jgi:hypothetical protein
MWQVRGFDGRQTCPGTSRRAPRCSELSGNRNMHSFDGAVAMKFLSNVGISKTAYPHC